MKTDKTLGVLGGMGPAATADFLKILAKKAPASTDQEHPRTIIYNYTKIPDRTTYLLGKGPDPRPLLREGLETLIGWGVDYLCVTCNTAHYFIDEIRSELSVPVIHIIDETIRKARTLSPSGAWLTATLGTMKTGLYQRHAADSGYNFDVAPYDVQVEIHDVTDLVKAGRIAEAASKFKPIVEALWKEKDQPVVCACTELPIAYEATGLPPQKGINCLEALADGCIRELYGLEK